MLKEVVVRVVRMMAMSAPGSKEWWGEASTLAGGVLWERKHRMSLSLMYSVNWRTWTMADWFGVTWSCWPFTAPCLRCSTLKPRLLAVYQRSYNRLWNTVTFSGQKVKRNAILITSMLTLIFILFLFYPVLNRGLVELLMILQKVWQKN